MADLLARPEPRRLRPQVVRTVAGRTVVRGEGRTAGRQDWLHGLVPPPQRPDDERYDPHLRLLTLQRRRKGPREEHVPDRELPRGRNRVAILAMAFVIGANLIHV